jgi:DNA replication protein DnaC
MGCFSKSIRSRCPACVVEENQREKIYIEQRYVQEKQHQMAQLLSQSCLPERFQSSTFEQYQAESNEQAHALKVARGYAESFEKRLSQGSSLLLSGKPGTGKTHLAVAIANYVLQQGHAVLFTSVLRATRAVKDCYRSNSKKTVQEAIDELQKPALLILDEVGVQFGSDTEKLILFEILNSRYEALLPTILISNLSEAELTHAIGARCFDRLQEGGGVSLRFTWESYRKNSIFRTEQPCRRNVK